MIWQDIVIAFSLAFALIINNHKPEKSSCMLSIICLLALSVCFATLNLWFSFAAEVTGIITWGILLF